ncbi:diguanylate cyclase (GGDEF)-like protein [Sphingomonas endophytica]|uniref:diguanylate cyclase n=1 Tax=Sphingomonas endophytica TaxID=869719 RepID=A0A7X0J8Z3_9SPHN|nr:GGDEF domain-containing protein [Sphingomonas endophytica]MBB6503309.1 diguanylate cyclase (GGDEF)-like protein [Sphingomonas endophytica]
MSGAVYALIVNACVAMLFAATFAVLRASYPQQRASGWFCATYAIGLFSPLSELGVRFASTPALFTATSYLTLVLSMLCFTLGVAQLSGRRPPRAAAAIAVVALFGRVMLADGARNSIGYGLVYQFPFYTMLLLCTVMAIRAVRERRDPSWAALGIIFAVTASHFLVKPFFAAAFGSGATMRDYAASSYALFSQALGGLLTIASALAVLLMIVRAVLRSTRAESETDMLTCIANRRGFERRAAGLIALSRREGQAIAAIMLDLDHFKQVNDRFGHATGDAVLQAVGQALTRTAPRDALIARLGGEEFVALLGGTGFGGAARVAEEFRVAVTRLGPGLPPVTVSGGIAELRPHDTLVTLLDRADRQAYEAKQAGRDRIYPAPSSAT